MGHRYHDIAFTDAVKDLQAGLGSRRAYERQEAAPDDHDRLGPRERAFIAARDSFYMASVSETGWPYVQHRGGPAGFVTGLGDSTIGFAGFAGNRQYVSLGNLAGDGRVSLFFMDYPNRLRLKLFGRARLVRADETAVLVALAVPGYRARVERGIAIEVAAFDWNCPAHITPRFTAGEVEAAMAPLKARIAELEARLAAGPPG